jgi:large subunit ribosomal protein L30
MPELLAVIRIRSLIDRRPEVRFTARLLRLTRVNICTLYPKTSSILGMLKVVSEVTTYGEINKDVLIELLKKRGRIKGNKKLTEEILQKYNFATFEELAEHILKTGKIPNFIKPVFRLSPPKKGFKHSTKKFFSQGGELGYRGEKINELILRMI